VLQTRTSDARIWEAATIDGSSAWYWQLSGRVQNALEQSIAQMRRRACLPTDLRLADSPCAACGADLQPVRNALEQGRGFAIVRGLPAEASTLSERQTMYWLVGQMLGHPVAQNIQGTLLYDVKDTNQDVRYGARFSVTNAESTFHTDNSFGEDVVDYVGLLCLEKAHAGGLSQVVSGYSVHERLLAEHPDALDVLYRPFQFDRRGGLRPGDAPTIAFPIFSADGAELQIRYLRYWIEAGHEKAGVPLSAAQKTALDLFDSVANIPELRIEFHLEPGDIFFINNRWILHNRTAFEDNPEPERRRHLVRLWLERSRQVLV
jgi:alpha-ketoglutarate-dependent taurine dioxygenase